MPALDNSNYIEQAIPICLFVSVSVLVCLLSLICEMADGYNRISRAEFDGCL